MYEHALFVVPFGLREVALWRGEGSGGGLQGVVFRFNRVLFVSMCVSFFCVFLAGGHGCGQCGRCSLAFRLGWR